MVGSAVRNSQQRNHLEIIKFRDGLELTSGEKLPNFNRVLDPGYDVFLEF